MVITPDEIPGELPRVSDPHPVPPPRVGEGREGGFRERMRKRRSYGVSLVVNGRLIDDPHIPLARPRSGQTRSIARPRGYGSPPGSLPRIVSRRALDTFGAFAYHALMKLTQYFLHTHERPDRRDIKLEWIKRVIATPLKEIVQSDGRIKRWGRIPEAGGKYLRVVLLEDGETVHNAFFDRRFQEVEDEG